MPEMGDATLAEVTVTRGESGAQWKHGRGGTDSGTRRVQVQVTVTKRNSSLSESRCTCAPLCEIIYPRHGTQIRQPKNAPMLTEAVLSAIAEAVFSHLAQESGLTNRVRAVLRVDPQRRALQTALAKAYASFAQ
ncbi:MAG: hypothetical protein NZ699_04150 [Roseiflexus sp.]|nr:hypothetical protein [Roseiflexus sp.]MCS7288306.1 hypothetical protein [Roseiflexus sp.]MDW8148918.1 hypothetical protein [Roseiflexaceae bacterium]